MTPQRNNRTLMCALTLSVTGGLAGSERPLAATRAPEWTAVCERTAGWLGADGIYSTPLNGYDAAIGPRQNKDGNRQQHHTLPRQQPSRHTQQQTQHKGRHDCNHRQSCGFAADRARTLPIPDRRTDARMVDKPIVKPWRGARKGESRQQEKRRRWHERQNNAGKPKGGRDKTDDKPKRTQKLLHAML